MLTLEQLNDTIPDGSENALSGREIARKFNVSYRAVTLFVNILRRRGAVICSCQRGYYKPLTPDEARRFVRVMRSRVRQIRAATQSAERYVKTIDAASDFDGRTLLMNGGEDNG